MDNGLPRPDAAVKVTGRAPFVGDLRWPDVLEGVFVTSTVPVGGLVELDVREALEIPGVARVIQPGDLGELPHRFDHWALGQETLPLADRTIRHFGQPIGLVLAETRAAASRAARTVRARYLSRPAELDFEARLDAGVPLDDWAPAETDVGMVDPALAGAPVVVSRRYHTADRHHVAIEPSVVLARWEQGMLEVATSTQWISGVRAAMAAIFGVSPEAVRVRADFVGGGFGAKGSVWPHEILAAAAARAVGRPVRIELTREQTFYLHGHQPRTTHHIELGADSDGRLLAIRHRSWSAGARHDDYLEHGSKGSRSAYACPNIQTREKIVRLDRPQPTAMRAPNEGPGMVGLEIAMDELAEKLGLDPIELRRRNYATRDPTSGLPFSSKALDQCYLLAAERFGWRDRDPTPRSMRRDGAPIGWGMATALMPTFRSSASARVTATRQGEIIVETASHEIGSGVRAMLARVVGEVLEVDPRRVEVQIGDSALPKAGGTSGSSTTGSVGSAAHVAAQALRARFRQLFPEGWDQSDFATKLQAIEMPEVSATGSWSPKEVGAGFAMSAFGAVLVEVKIDPLIPIPRVTRCVAVYSVGRVLDPRGAQSQLVGGLIWGIGQALHEESVLDRYTGAFVAPGFGGYRVPSAADVTKIEVHLVSEFDRHAGPLGGRGVGEVGTIGIGASIANAIYHCSGIRVRQVPIRVEHLLE